MATTADAGEPIVDAEAGCGRRPPPPPRPTQQGADAGTYWFVITSASQGSGGYDLDCVDSRCGEAPETVPSRCAFRARGSFCDEPGGADNQFSRTQARRALELDDSRYQDRLQKGESALVVGVLGYDGQSNDSDVTVTMFPARLCKGSECGDAGNAPADGGSLQLTLDGNATFAASDRDLGIGRPTTVVTGYVTQGRLVVEGPHKQWLAYGSRYVEADGHVIEAAIDVRPADGGVPSLRGGLAGGMSAEAILRVLGEQRDPNAAEKVPLCKTAGRDLIRAAACAELDLPAAGASQESMPEAPCGAMSYYVEFTAVAAWVTGATSPIDPRVPQCAFETAGAPRLGCD